MKKYLHNPLSFDVTKQYSLNGAVTTYTLPAEKITEFDNETVFTHMRDYLTEVVLNERGIVHFDMNREKVREEIVKDFE